MKVGILSMQRIKNYGSFLQAFALKSILEELGADVEFVDYHPGETLIPSDGGMGIKRKIIKGVEAWKGSAPPSEKIRFINYKRNYAEKYYPYLGITDEMNYSPKLDVLVIGSDEVFNCVQNNTNVGFAPELFGQESNAEKVISYAASFGNTTFEKLKQYGVDLKVTGWLKSFDALSVRDENSARIVEALTGNKPEINLDPVLMYDFITDRKTSKGVIEDNYILQHAEYIVTDTFHGTILSTITHRPFASIVRNAGYGNSEKLLDLLKRLRLESRIWNNLSELEDLLQEGQDYKETDYLLQRERIRTREYLRKWVC